LSLKERILKVLEENRDQFVSGQELAERLNVSRTAVWKAVKKLKQEGHEITASTNSGYRLEYLSDILSEPGIRLYLSSKNKELPIFIYDQAESTNSLAKKLAAEGAQNGSLVVAEEQSKGRGRMGRSFYSPSGTGLYMSMILSVHEELASALFTTIYAAVAVCRVINRLAGREARIKWVNDILIDGKKVCGILTESISDFESGMVETVILGIGLNIKTEVFPDEIRDTADSLSVYHIPRNRFVAEIANEVLLLKQESRKIVIEEYKRRSMMLGREIEYLDKGCRRSGKVLDINDSGHLIVEGESGEITALMYGEVVVKKTGLYKE
jgi:BirA family biotin operon repressor/biotin-[acetyl-CoA-carboxylase] ligase